MSILIIGATGQVGQQTVLSLLKVGGSQKIKLLVRDENKARQLFEKHEGSTDALEYFTGDYQSNLNDKAFENIERLFIVNHEPQYDNSIFRKAIEKSPSSFKQIVKLSAHGASWDNDFGGFLRGHSESENEIYKLATERDIAFVFLRPTMFSQNFHVYDGPGIKAAGKLFRPGLPENDNLTLSYIDTRDIGEAVAVALTEPVEKTRNRTYVLTAPEVYTAQEVAELFTRIVGKPVDIVPLDDYAYYQLLIEHGTPEVFAFGMTKLYQLARLNKVIAYGDFQMLTGRQARTLAQYIEDHKHLF